MDNSTLHLLEKRGTQQTATQVVAKLTTWVRSAHWFYEQMLAKILRNTHKSGWQECSIEYLRYRLLEELKEFDDECTKEVFIADKAIEECADIANFAMMMADRIRNGATPSTKS